MKKTYFILQRVSTSLESKTVSQQYGYGTTTLYSYLFRDIDSTEMDYDKRSLLEDGFETLQEA